MTNLIGILIGKLHVKRLVETMVKHCFLKRSDKSISISSDAILNNYEIS